MLAFVSAVGVPVVYSDRNVYILSIPEYVSLNTLIAGVGILNDGFTGFDILGEKWL